MAASVCSGSEIRLANNFETLDLTKICFTSNYLIFEMILRLRKLKKYFSQML